MFQDEWDPSTVTGLPRAQAPALTLIKWVSPDIFSGFPDLSLLICLMEEMVLIQRFECIIACTIPKTMSGRW